MHQDGRESFEAWARARQSHLVRAAYVLTGDFHRAEDLVQEALVRAAIQWDALRQGDPDAWVRTVVYRANVSWWRRHRREVVSPIHAHSRAREPTGLALQLRDALAQLTWNQRAVVLLRYVEDLSVADTADALGVSQGTVKKQASIARARLRQLAPELAEHLVEGP